MAIEKPDRVPAIADTQLHTNQLLKKDVFKKQKKLVAIVNGIDISDLITE